MGKVVVVVVVVGDAVVGVVGVGFHPVFKVIVSTVASWAIELLSAAHAALARTLLTATPTRGVEEEENDVVTTMVAIDVLARVLAPVPAPANKPTTARVLAFGTNEETVGMMPSSPPH